MAIDTAEEQYGHRASSGQFYLAKPRVTQNVTDILVTHHHPQLAVVPQPDL